jgi:hypothetical protein
MGRLEEFHDLASVREELHELARTEYNRLVSEYPSWDEEKLWSTAYAKAEDYLEGLANFKHDQAIEEILPNENDGSNRQADFEWRKFMERRLHNVRRKELIKCFK